MTKKYLSSSILATDLKKHIKYSKPVVTLASHLRCRDYRTFVKTPGISRISLVTTTILATRSILISIGQSEIWLLYGSTRKSPNKKYPAISVVRPWDHHFYQSIVLGTLYLKNSKYLIWGVQAHLYVRTTFSTWLGLE